MQNLTVNKVKDLTNCIYVQYGFIGEFKPLTDFNGFLFFSIGEAKSFIRKHLNGVYVGLATYEQALMNNAQWDNI